MPAESIESFVKTLQSEGVEAGKKAGEKIRKQAEEEAEKILSDARAEAEKIISRARGDADKLLLRGRTELELAARDVTLRLRESIGKGLSAMLSRNIEKKLSNPDYLGEILREVIVAYAEADTQQRPLMEINISEDTRDKLNENLLKDLFRSLGETEDRIALKATLAKAGFEYKIQGATVEVTPDSLSEMISEMVGPALQDALGKFMDRKEEKIPLSDDSESGEKSALEKE